MDPTACYREMCEAMNEGDMMTACERAESLKAWLSRGGFYPAGYSNEEVDTLLATILGKTPRRSNR